MVILKLIDVFEIHVHFKMIVLKTRADVFELHVHFKVMKLQLSTRIFL